MKKSDRNYETSDSEAETNARLRYDTPLVCSFIVFVSKNAKKKTRKLKWSRDWKK